MRKVLYTLNNPTMEEIKAINAFKDHSQFRFCAFQGEYGKDEVPHIHCYLEITKNQRQSFFKALLPRAHISFVKKGTCEENIHYCSKPVAGCTCAHCIEAITMKPKWLQPVQYGQPSKMLEGDAFWDTLYYMIEDNATNAEILEQLPQCGSMLKTIDDLRGVQDEKRCLNTLVKNPKRDWRDIRVLWIYGSTGVGKTSSVWKAFPDLYLARGAHPWDAYRGHKVVLIDDINPKRFDFFDLYNILDRYPVNLDARYSDKYARYNDVFITSNFEPSIVYSDVSEYSMSALYRRIHVVLAFHDASGILRFRWNEESYDFASLLAVLPYRLAKDEDETPSKASITLEGGAVQRCKLKDTSVRPLKTDLGSVQRCKLNSGRADDSELKEEEIDELIETFK